DFGNCGVLGVPEDEVTDAGQTGGAERRCLSKRDQAHEVLAAEDLVHYGAYEVDVLVPDLDEDRAALGQQLLRHVEPVAQVREIRVDPELPRVAEGLDLLNLA